MEAAENEKKSEESARYKDEGTNLMREFFEFCARMRCLTHPSITTSVDSPEDDATRYPVLVTRVQYRTTRWGRRVNN